MIRNRKAIVGGFMPRVAAVWEVELTDRGARGYEAVTKYVADGLCALAATQRTTRWAS